MDEEKLVRKLSQEQNERLKDLYFKYIASSEDSDQFFKPE